MKNEFSFDPLAWAGVTGTNTDNDAARTVVVNHDDNITPTNEADKAKAVAQMLVDHGANIADGYDEWLRLGFALADGLGAEGGEWFHALSAQSSKYNAEVCERKWQECLKKHDGRTTIASFFQMAQQAGVDLSAVSRQFSSSSPLRHTDATSDSMLKKEMNTITKVSDCEISMQNGVDDIYVPFSVARESDAMAKLAEVLPFKQTFSDGLDIGALPSFLSDLMDMQETAEDRDKMLLCTLNLVSGFTPNVYGVYDRRRVYPPFYAFVVAPSGSDKGVLPACLSVVSPVIGQIRGQSEALRREYRQRKAEYEACNKHERAQMQEPEEPPYRSPLISVNASATAFYQDLAANEGWGAVFETEADTMATAIKQDYGDYSSGLRKAFHHEAIDYSRRKDDEHVYISEPRLSAFITCTPGQLPTLLSPQKVENGLANRFVFYMLKKGRGWRNVFEDCEVTLSDRMKSFGTRFKHIYDELVSFTDRPLVFTLNAEQKEAFNSYFRPLYDEQIGLYGDDLEAFVKRLGLVTYRIAMVLTVLRHEGQLTAFYERQEPLVCSEVDYQTAIAIASCLINHTAYVYSRLLPHDRTPVGVSGRTMGVQEQQLLNALPGEFTHKLYVEVASTLGISARTAERYVGGFIAEYGVVARVSQGHYRKL
ncbi:MAG: DUF3987 domain-containing protein [Prevotella sp.]|nr:DUF3987 domain-containing protein [Prevotella sp.]